MRISSRTPAVATPEAIAWNEAAWPVLRITLRDGGDERFVSLLKQFQGLFERRQQYVLFIDTTALSAIPSGATRHAIGTWQKRFQEDTQKWCLGAAILISSRLIRGAATAMDWVHEPAVQHYYPATRREAYAWCISKVDEAGVTLPAAAREVLQSPDS